MSEIVGAALLVIGWGVFMRWLLSPNERKSIYGVYSQPGKYYYVKFIFFYLLVNFRQVKELSIGSHCDYNSFFHSGEVNKQETVQRKPKLLDTERNPSMTFLLWKACSSFQAILR